MVGFTITKEMTVTTKTGNPTNKMIVKDDDYQIEAVDSATFNKAAFPRVWLIEDVLMLNQPGVIGGPKKTLKTSLLVDMAVSIGTGRPFLGKFSVTERRRVAVFSGESDRATLQDTARRVCRARGVSLQDCAVHWSFTLPSLNQNAQRRALRTFLRENKIKVVFIDPLYLCLLDGSRSISASNLYEIGPLLWQAAQVCLDAGAIPLFVHHATKAASKRTEALDLDDLAFAGIGEFVRQWVLLGRREPFQPDVGQHRLVMTTGGSGGHAGWWDLTVEEGVLETDFTGRKWKVIVQPLETASAAVGRPQNKKNKSKKSFDAFEEAE